MSNGVSTSYGLRNTIKRSRDITVQIHRYSAEHHANFTAFPGSHGGEQRSRLLIFGTEKHKILQYFILE